MEIDENDFQANVLFHCKQTYLQRIVQETCLERHNNRKTKRTKFSIKNCNLKTQLENKINIRNQLKRKVFNFNMATKKLAATFNNSCVKTEKDDNEVVINCDSDSEEEGWEKVENTIDDDEKSVIFEDAEPGMVIDLTFDDEGIDVKNTTGSTEENKAQETSKKEEKQKTSSEENTTHAEENVNPTSNHIAFTYAPIPAAYPREKTIVVYNLPPRCNRHDLISAFSKYGAITYIQKMRTFAFIAFETQEEAQNATLANNMLRIWGWTIGVRVRDVGKRFRDYPSDQVAFVFDLMPNIPDKIVREHFASCGKIISMPYYRCRNGVSRILIFEKSGSADIALHLNGSCIGNSKIRVKPRGSRAENYHEGRTVVLLNVSGLVEVAKSTIIDIFSKCGNIVECDLLCNLKKLAIITFKDEASVENAMKLSGTTVGKIQILLDPYTKTKYGHTRIMAYNLAPGITTTKIAEAFNKIAVLDKVHYVKGRPFALIELATTQDYCNAFQLDGEDLCGRGLVLKPFPDRDESLEFIMYGKENFIIIWGDRPQGFRGKKRRIKNQLPKHGEIH